MFKRFLHFATYNNAFVLILLALMGSAGVTFAANPEVRAGILSSQDTVRSIDNSYLLAVDLSQFSFDLKIKSIAEDADTYYVTYSYNAIEVTDYVWKVLVKEDLLKVGKKTLDGKDLGVYVARQLGEIAESRIAFLRDAQASERKAGLTAKIVTTEYSGLIGKMLNPSEKEFPGYIPVVKEATSTESLGEELAAYLRNGTPYARADLSAAIAGTATDSGGDSDNPRGVSEEERIAEEVNQVLAQSTAGESLPPIIVLRGENPLRVLVGTKFTDPGADVFDDKDGRFDAVVTDGEVDATKVGQYVLIYGATDSTGNNGSPVTRFIEVYEHNSDAGPRVVPVEPTSSEPVVETPVESVPDVQPEPQPETEPEPEPAPVVEEVVPAETATTTVE